MSNCRRSRLAECIVRPTTIKYKFAAAFVYFCADTIPYNKQMVVCLYATFCMPLCESSASIGSYGVFCSVDLKNLTWKLMIAESRGDNPRTDSWSTGHVDRNGIHESLRDIFAGIRRGRHSAVYGLQHHCQIRTAGD